MLFRQTLISVSNQLASIVGYNSYTLLQSVVHAWDIMWEYAA